MYIKAKKCYWLNFNVVFACVKEILKYFQFHNFYYFCACFQFGSPSVLQLKVDYFFCFKTLKSSLIIYHIGAILNTNIDAKITWKETNPKKFFPRVIHIFAEDRNFLSYRLLAISFSAFLCFSANHFIQNSTKHICATLYLLPFSRDHIFRIFALFQNYLVNC